MAKNTGTLITSAIRPNDSLDLIASAFANEIKGGNHGYLTFSFRDSIITERREWGMFCSVWNPTASLVENYQLTYNNNSTNISDNLNWKLYSNSSTSDNVFLQNGNSFGASNILGSNDNQSLSFKTNNIVRMTIATSGDLDIPNTINIGGDLSVTGNLTITGTATVINSTNITVQDSIIELAKGQVGQNSQFDSGILINRGLGGSGSNANVAFVWKEDVDRFVLIGTGLTANNTSLTFSNYEDLQTRNIFNEYNLITASSSATNSIVFSTKDVNSSSIFDIYHNGDINIGGGYTSSSAKFSITGGSHSSGYIMSIYNSNFYPIRILNNGNILVDNNSTFIHNNGLFLNTTNEYNILSATNTSLVLGANNANVLTITASGYIGINTSQPLGNVHINSGNSNFSNGLILDQYSSGNSGRLFFITNGLTGTSIYYHGASQALHFSTEATPNITSGTIRMWLYDNGNLSIGSSSNTYRLNVISGADISASFDGRVIGATALNANEFTTLGQLSLGFSSSCFTQNGNSFGATALLGTNDNQTLVLETNGLHRMMIATNGNIGLSVPIPTHLLDIGTSSSIKIRALNHTYSQAKPLYVDNNGVILTATFSNNPLIITDSVVITALITITNWDVSGNWLGGLLNGYAGQYYRNSDWFFFFYNDGDPMRMMRG